MLRIRVFLDICCVVQWLVLDISKNLRLDPYRRTHLGKISGTTQWYKPHDLNPVSHNSLDKIFLMILSKPLLTPIPISDRQLGNWCYIAVKYTSESEYLLQCRSWFKMDLQEVQCGCIDWIKLAQDRDTWQALVSAVMNLRLPQNVGNFLTSCKPVSCPRTLLHGVSEWVK
jgi:hypothetical protein